MVNSKLLPVPMVKHGSVANLKKHSKKWAIPGLFLFIFVFSIHS